MVPGEADEHRSNTAATSSCIVTASQEELRNTVFPTEDMSRSDRLQRHHSRSNAASRTSDLSSYQYFPSSQRPESSNLT